jgi:hypothetical protein
VIPEDEEDMFEVAGTPFEKVPEQGLGGIPYIPSQDQNGRRGLDVGNLLEGLVEFKVEVGGNLDMNHSEIGGGIMMLVITGHSKDVNFKGNPGRCCEGSPLLENLTHVYRNAKDTPN